MNLKILYITLGILSTELLAAQNKTMDPMHELHDIAFVPLTGTTNIIGLTICHL